MAEADPPARTISLGTGVAAVDAAAWDALAGGGNPFVSHAFLALLEESGSVGPGTGWQAAPILDYRQPHRHASPCHPQGCRAPA